MRTLLKPETNVRDLLALCIPSIREVAFRSGLNSVVDQITLEENRYDVFGARAEFFRIAGSSDVGGLISKDQMVWLYDNKLSKKGAPARHIYDAIKMGASSGICPVCNQRDVATLDHYLAKTTHPVFAVTPINLVPSCSDCNKIKSTDQAATAEKQTFHPYFDNVDDDVWLKASVQESNIPTVTFSTVSPNGWSSLKYERVETHFNKFGLGVLYATQAARELSQIRGLLVKMASSGGASEVRNHLEAQAASRSAGEKNSWQAAMYRGLAESVWFSDGGLRGIPCPS